jgi:hypothetical protein
MNRPKKNERLAKRRQSAAAPSTSMFDQTTQLFNAYTTTLPQTRIDPDPTPKKRDFFPRSKSKPREEEPPSYLHSRRLSQEYLQMSDFTTGNQQFSPMYTSLHLPDKRRDIGITVGFD